MATAAAAVALGSAGTAATATTAATAATTGLFGSAGAFSFMQTASTLGSAMGIFSTLAGGGAENKMYEQQARWEEIRARQEQIKGMQEANAIKEDLVKNIASANARGAASGIDITSGSPVTAVQQATQDANDAMSLAKANAATNADVSRANASTYRAKGKNAIRSSRSRAIGLASDFAMRQGDRGFSF